MKYWYIPVLMIAAVVLFVWYLDRKAKEADPRWMVMPLPGDRKAVTMPPFGIYIEPDAEDVPEIRKHEMCHWNQYKEKGLVDFYREYFNHKGQHDYENNPMEQACFIAEIK